MMMQCVDCGGEHNIELHPITGTWYTKDKCPGKPVPPTTEVPDEQP